MIPSQLVVAAAFLVFSTTSLALGGESPSWEMLRLNAGDRMGSDDELFDAKTRSLQGQRISLRGFIYPQSVYTIRPKRFLLIAEVKADDQRFASWSSLPTHLRVLVELKDGLRTNYTTGVVEVRGELRLRSWRLSDGTIQTVYTILADQVSGAEARNGFLSSLKDGC
ncbi:MAG: hypothetical protein AAFV88_08775 [Planctomycetota bacterium]